MEFLLDYGLFLAKIVTVVAAVVVLLIIAKSAGGKSGAAKGELEVTNLSERHKDAIEQLEHHLHDDAFIKLVIKRLRRKRKKRTNLARKKSNKRAKKVLLIASANRICSCWTSTAALMQKKWVAT